MSSIKVQGRKKEGKENERLGKGQGERKSSLALISQRRKQMGLER